MTLRFSSLCLLFAAPLPFVIATQQSAPSNPTAEQVFKDIEVFKGHPAKDLIPAMEYMAASLKVGCDHCHVKDDYAADHEQKEVSRKMVLMQRDINTKFFDGRPEVSCNSCHNGREHPEATPIPESVRLRHPRLSNAPKPDDLLKKHAAAVGPEPASLTLTGKMTSPTGENHADVVSDVTMVFGSGGRFRVQSGFGVFGFDGTTVWRDTYPLTDEPAAIFHRMGRSWRGDTAFTGLDRLAVNGTETLGKVQTTIVRGQRTETGSSEELYFDNKSGRIVRMVNLTRCSLGTVVTSYDYSNYKKIGPTQVPMKVVVTFAGGEHWTMDFKKAEVGTKVDAALFEMPKG